MTVAHRMQYRSLPLPTTTSFHRTPAARAAVIITVALLLGTAAALACRPAHAQSGGGCAGEGVARVAYEPRTFLGYACRDADCAAHKAGFAWADRDGIADAADCAGADDPAFTEGCRAFVEDAVTAEHSGFQWARENEVGDTCQCGGAGPRFEAGCEAYVAIVR